MLHDFSCSHIKNTNNSALPVLSYPPKASDTDQYPCTEQVKGQISKCIQEAASRSFNIVSQLAENIFAVYGPPTASNPIGFCHVKSVSGQLKPYFVCTGKDCRSFFSRAKQIQVKAISIHLHILSCCTGLFHIPAQTASSPVASGASSTSSVTLSEQPSPNISAFTVHTASTSTSMASTSTSTMSEQPSQPLSRIYTVQLYMARKIPYKMDKELINGIIKKDCHSALHLPGGWPDSFFPEECKCSLCGSALSTSRSHPGQSGSSYLLTENNPFKSITIRVKVCTNNNCKAMHQVFPIDIGM
jgi:hypothetical protein